MLIQTTESYDSILYCMKSGRQVYLLVGEKLSPRLPTTFRHRYYTAIKKVAGVRPLSPYCCRHTYITCLQAMGVPIELIARLAGHSHISITDGYTHTSAETLAQAVTALDKGDAADDWRPPAPGCLPGLSIAR